MLGIEEIGSYIPEKTISNIARGQLYGVEQAFIEDKIGVRRITVKDNDEDTSDLCVKAFESLSKKVQIDKARIDVLVVVTQNPDCNIPHTSAIVHEKLGFREDCACFDVSLGCSGFVYGLSIIESFMQNNGFKRGLLFTCDPYSKIIDPDDKNTVLLFGDAATVALISDNPLYTALNYSFGTDGKGYRELTCKNNKLYMNGRAIFSYSVKYVPAQIKMILSKNAIGLGQIDKFILHQGSKYIIDTIRKRLGVEDDRVVFDMYEYGNTVSSSIPIILEQEIKNNMNRHIVVCGFGVGFSWATAVLKRNGAGG